MKMNKLQKSLAIIVLTLMFSTFQKSYAISDNFKFVIDTIGVPRYNVYGRELNEEIYKAYNIFSYGAPEELSTRDGQRWKNSKYGLWSKGQGAYNGSGIRGEYNLLGRDYSGNIINNYYFPVDALPETTPENWCYYSNPGALASWSDKNKYKYVEQLEYMKTTKLLFNDISSRDNSDNPEKIKEYNITASKIGLDKARLDVCSTWKTNGIIHTRRKVGNKIRYAVFLTKPMAADANIKSGLEINKNITMEETENKVLVEIGYGANIINMTGYANKNHIKEIKSILYINGEEVNSISGSKISTLGGKYVLKLSREELAQEQNNIIKILNKSYAHTEFAVDGLMQDEVEQILNIYVEKSKIIPLQIDDIKIVEKEENALVVRPLSQCDETIKKDSFGISEAGRNVAIKLKKNENIADINLEDLTIYLNEEKLGDVDISLSKNGKNVIVKFKIPMYLNTSIYGWKSLREMYGNYFNILQEDIGKRIAEPHVLEIKYKQEDVGIVIKFDTIDDFVTNLNYRYTEKSSDNLDVKTLEEWSE